LWERRGGHVVVLKPDLLGVPAQTPTGSAAYCEYRTAKVSKACCWVLTRAGLRSVRPKGLQASGTARLPVGALL
jgi:hypothetical protein